MEFNSKTQALLRGLFAKDEDGKVFIRFVDEPHTGTLVNAVNSQSSISFESLLSKAIVRDVNGGLAIRLSAVEFGKTLGQHEFDIIEANRTAIDELQNPE